MHISATNDPDYSPIQLLRPDGLCSVVCPILILPSPSPPSSDVLNSTASRGVAVALLSALATLHSPNAGASSSGLGAGIADMGMGDMSPLNDAPPFEDMPGDGMAMADLGRNASANHSYHTFRLSVRRHRKTCSSELDGRYSGSWDGSQWRVRMARCKLTRSGKKIGNQLNIFGEM